MKPLFNAWVLLILAALLVGCGSNFEWLPSSNQTAAPRAHAGADQSVPYSNPVTLDGSGSTSSSGQTLTYFWAGSSPSGQTISISNPTAVKPSFTPDAVGTYTFTLYVNDGKNYSLPATTRVLSLPAANAGPNQTNVLVNSLVTLDGTGSNAPAGDPLTYNWTFTGYPTTNAPLLAITNPAKPTFVPTVVGTYTLRLIVHDGAIASPPATVTINAVTNTGTITVTW